MGSHGKRHNAPETPLLRSLWTRLTLFQRLALGAVLPVGLLLAGYSAYLVAREHQVSREARELDLFGESTRQAQSIQALLREVSRPARYTAQLGVVMPDMSTEKYWAWLRDVLDSNSAILGAGITFWPPNRAGKRKDLYVVRGDKGNFARDGYAYQDETYTYDGTDGTHAWFSVPQKVNQPIWSEPYYDDGSGYSWMVTYSVPFRRADDDRFDGVAICDVSLDTLDAQVRAGGAFGTRTAVLSAGGIFVLHADRKLAGQPRSEWKVHPELAELLSVQGPADVPVRVADWPGLGRVWAIKRIIAEPSWALVTVQPDLAIAFGLERHEWGAMGFLALGLAASLGVTLLLARQFARRTSMLSRVARDVTSGKQEVQVPDLGNDEIGDLARDLGTMIQRLAQRDQELLREHESVAQLNHSLEARVIERTHELDAARVTAQRASESKSAFIASMSHELRTPLNAIIGLSTLALDTPLNSIQRDWLNKIKQSSSVLLGLINDILDLSKIEAGKLELEKTPFEPHQLIDYVVDLLSPRAHEKGLLLRREIDSSVPWSLRGDTLRLTQVLINLVSNALKFTEHGEVRLHVARVPAPDESATTTRWLRFEIRDTGIGLRPDQTARLFEAFTQADSSITRRYGGTGLGLAICRQIVEAMGGEIGVNSVEGEGSTFWFVVGLEEITDEAASALVPPPALPIHDTAAHISHALRSRVPHNVDAEVLRERLAQLLQLLEHDDGGAVDRWHALLEQWPQLVDEPLVAQLQRQLSQYDFDKACTTVKMWVQLLSRSAESVRGEPSEPDR